MILITNFVAYIIPDMPRKLREQIRREAYLTNEIIMKTELEIARGEDGIISDRDLASIRRRAQVTLRVSDAPNTDDASMNNKLGLDSESDGGGGGDAGSGVYQRRGKDSNGAATYDIEEETSKL